MSARLGRPLYSKASNEIAESPSVHDVPKRGATLRSRSLPRIARDRVLSSIEESSSEEPVIGSDGISHSPEQSRFVPIETVEEMQATMAEMDAKINRFLESRLLSSIYDYPPTRSGAGSARRWSMESGTSGPVTHAAYITHYRDMPRRPKGIPRTQPSARAAGVLPSKVRTNTPKATSLRGIREDSIHSFIEVGLADRLKGWMKRANWRKQSTIEATPVSSEWSPKDDGRLLLLLKQGWSYKRISRALPLHSAEDCQKRWENHLRINRVYIYKESPVQDPNQDAHSRA